MSRNADGSCDAGSGRINASAAWQSARDSAVDALFERLREVRVEGAMWREVEGAIGSLRRVGR